jgi:hypothetical protein
MSRQYISATALADREIDYLVSVTGAAPNAAPTLATQGVDVRGLGSVIVKVTVDQATAGGTVEVNPWIYGRARNATAGAVDAWTPLVPMFVDAIAGGYLGQELRISTEAADRLYLQVTPSSAAVAWAHAEAFNGLLRAETLPVTMMGLREILTATLMDYLHRDYKLLAAVTHGIDDTYYYYVDCRAVKASTGFEFVIDPGSGSVTCTIEATLQDDGTAPAACTYGDVTQQVTGAATVTATGVYVTRDLLNVVRYLRVKVVANTGGANDGHWRITCVRA